MKLNENKCHLLVSGFKHEVLWAVIGDKRIWECTENKLLGLHIDRDLKFTSRFSKLCTHHGRTKNELQYQELQNLCHLKIANY